MGLPWAAAGGALLLGRLADNVHRANAYNLGRELELLLQDRLVAAEIDDVFAGLALQAAAALSKEGFAEADHVFARTADLRYFGQAFEVRVPVPAGDLDDAAL